MVRAFAPLFFGILLLSAAGCHLNRSLASLSLSQIISSEQSRRGVAALEQGNLAEAEKRLEDAVKLSKNDINYRRYYAEVLWQQGKLQESLRQLNESVKRGGRNNPSLHISLAEKYLAQHEYSLALQHADEAIRLAPQNYRSWALSGRAKHFMAMQTPRKPEVSQQVLHQAREDLLRAVSLSPNDRELLSELAAVQMRCGQPERALAAWLEVQSLYPPNGEPADVLICKTDTLLALHRFDEAQGCLIALRSRGIPVPAMERRWQELTAAAQGKIKR